MLLRSVQRILLLNNNAMQAAASTIIPWSPALPNTIVFQQAE
jgi:hypothetical protein